MTFRRFKASGGSRTWTLPSVPMCFTQDCLSPDYRNAAKSGKDRRGECNILENYRLVKMNRRERRHCRYLNVSYPESHGVHAAWITTWNKQCLVRGMCKTAPIDLRFYYKWNKGGGGRTHLWQPFLLVTIFGSLSKESFEDFLVRKREKNHAVTSHP